MSALPAAVVMAEPSRVLLGDAHSKLQRLRLMHMPADLDQALADQLYGPLLRGMARDIARRQAMQAASRLPKLRFDARAAQAGDGL